MKNGMSGLLIGDIVCSAEETGNEMDNAVRYRYGNIQ